MCVSWCWSLITGPSDPDALGSQAAQRFSVRGPEQLDPTTSKLLMWSTKQRQQYAVNRCVIMREDQDNTSAWFLITGQYGLLDSECMKSSMGGAAALLPHAFGLCINTAWSFCCDAAQSLWKQMLRMAKDCWRGLFWICNWALGRRGWF